MTINYITSINDTNKEKVQLLIESSLQAYNAFDDSHPDVCQCKKISPPSKEYEFVECWTGIDSLFTDDKTKEIYGVVFRTLKAPYTYIFAFRGTASILDIVDDLGVEHSNFVAYDKNVTVDENVKVEAGFYDVYTEGKDGTEPMQTQLFKLIDKYQSSNKSIDQLFITGHSLGSSLSVLFTLDVALSRPNINASNINFACPRTGNKTFTELYDSQSAEKNKLTQTLRVQNTYDKVPCVPLNIMEYSHTNYAYLVAFYKDTFAGELDLLSCHSALNYKAVIQCASDNSQGICVNGDLPVPDNGKGYSVVSKLPNKNTVCHLW